MLFGRKKKEDEAVLSVTPVEKAATEAVSAPAPAPEPAPEPAPVPAPAPAASLATPAQSPASASVTVTPDYTSARVIAANHIIVNAGNEKLVLDIARELSGDVQKRMPVDTRVVMTVATAQRLQAALVQALAKAK